MQMKSELLEKNLLSDQISEVLAKKPEAVERFELSDDKNFTVDFMTFSDRPYVGSDCIITNGVSNFFEGVKKEFILIYERSSDLEKVDLNAFLAT